MAQYPHMEWRDARWVGYCAVTVLWVLLLGTTATKLPGGAGGGVLVQQQVELDERIVRPPVPTTTERIHVYTGSKKAARVFWEQPEAGRVHLTIELPEERDDESSEDSEVDTTPSTEDKAFTPSTDSIAQDADRISGL